MQTVLHTRRLAVFFVVWLGQLVSLVGSTLTSFALGVWVYEQSGSVTDYALVSVFFVLPGIILSPVAGAIADRWDRRKIMILSDTGAALSTLFIVLMMTAGQLELWHIYLSAIANATCSAFQTPAYTASISLLVPKKHYGRASGLVDLAGAVGYVISPFLAGVLMKSIGLQGVIMIDLITFFFAIGALLIVRFPAPARSEAGRKSKDTLLHELTYGWTYIRARPGLLALLVLFAVANLFDGITMVLFVPMILDFTTVDVLGMIGSISSIGFLLGGAIMSIWGGPKRRIRGVFIFGLLYGVATMLAGLQASAVLITAALFLIFFSTVFINGCSQAIWQSKVEPDVQGRVFSVRSMISISTLPAAYLISGPLADSIFEPLMAEGGALAGSMGPIIGAGRGIGLLFIVMGGFILLSVTVSYLYPRLRLVEDELPDFAAPVA